MRPTSVLLVLAALLARPSPARAEADPRIEARFAALAGAWGGRSAEGVVALMDPAPRSTLVLQLIDPPVASGAYPAAQAKQTLGEYFGRLRTASLKDVTPAKAKEDAPHVRLYDYGHRREGRDAVTTRLEVTLKRDANGRWNLGSVIERQRPR